jgi:hypothetical protein
VAEELCPLCGRPLGRRREKHHLVPKRYGGREIAILHPICHRKIHKTLSDQEVAAGYTTIEALRTHPEIARFVAWLAGKPPDFYKSTWQSRRRRKG